MKIDWKFILKKSVSILLKGLLILTGLYLVSVTILSLVYRPMGVKVTNVTSSSATVSWYTNVPMTGEVSYKEKDSFIPLFLSGIGADKAYDDRDFAYAQKLCVAAFNMKLEKEVDEDFTVSGEDYNCDNVKVSKLGRYYVHHVTIKNLDEKKDYYFRVGNRIWGWKGDVMSFKTFETPANVKEPVPVFGRIVSSEGKYSGDSIVYGRFKDLSSGNESVMYSSVTNDEGGWYLDGGNLRAVDGEFVELESGDDTFTVTGMYKNSKMSAPTTWVFGYFDGAYPDLKVTYTEKDNFLYKLVFGAYACSYPSDLDDCSEQDLQAFGAYHGYGNVAKNLAKDNGGVLDNEVLNKMGMCDNSTECAGNISAITGQGITQGEIDRSGDGQVHANLNQWGGWSDPKAGSADDQDDGSAPPTGGGNSGGANNSSGVTSPGQINATVDASGTWSLTFGGKEVSNLDDVLTEEQKNLLLSDPDNKCEAGKPCSFAVEVVEISFLSLLEKNPEIVSCINDRSCEVDGVYDLINSETEEKKKAIAQYGVVVEEILSSWDTPNPSYIDCKDITNQSSQCDKRVTSAFNGGVYYDGPIDQEWLTDFWSNLTLEEKYKYYTANSIFAPGVGVFQNSLSFTNSRLTINSNGDIILERPGFNVNLGPIEDGLVIPPQAYDNMKEPHVIDQDDERSEAVLPFTEVTYFAHLYGADAISEQAADKILTEYSDCIYAVSCSEEKAIALREELVDRGFEGIYIIDNGDGTAQLVRKPTEQELNEEKKKLEQQLKLLEDASPDGFVGFRMLKNLYDSFIMKSYAEESNKAESQGYVFFLPEYGMFSLQLGEFEVEKEIADGKTIYVFYLEVNGKDGLQPPKDPANRKISEDIVIKSNSFKISYEKKAEIRKYSLSTGLNIVSFDFIAKSPDDSPYTAKQLIDSNRARGLNIEYISYFEGGRWAEGLKCTSSSCLGNDFVILPGKGYLIKVGKAGSLIVPAYNLKSAIPLNLSAGWNLIGVHGYSSAYTAKSLINSINNIDGLTADNVSWYPTSKGRYEGLQVTDGVEYGFDFPVNPMNGYFVRIKQFAPKDEACRSVIWHDGNELNGTCGDSKSIF